MRRKGFLITEAEKAVLQVAVNRRFHYIERPDWPKACLHMLELGWIVRRDDSGTPFEITDAGRAVARQLGIEGGGA